MSARSGLALRLATLPLAALMAYAVARGAAAPTAEDGFEEAGLVIVLGGLAAAAIAAPPAWAVSGALALSLFQSHWDLLGPSFSVDRYALIVVIASVLAREWRHRDGRLQTRPVDWMLIVVATYAITSAWVVGELADRDARFELIDKLGLIPFALFFVAPLAFRTEADRRVLLGTLVAIGAYLGVTAIIETTGPEALVVPHYITDPAEGIHLDRARGPFLDAGANGIALYMCGVAAVVAFVKWRGRRWRIVALLVAGLCMLGVLLALTRIVWLAAIVASPIALAAARETRRYLIPAVGAAVAIVMLAVAVIPGLQGRVNTRRNDNSETLWARRNSNAAAVRMVEARPLVGFGWGRFAEDSTPYYRQSQDYPLTFLHDLHNVYLANAVELGLVGLFLWLAALAGAVGGAILRRGPPELRAWKLGLVAVAMGLLISWLTAPAEYVLPTLLMWLWAGVAWGAREPEPGPAAPAL
ncbi:MAG TPA: O-antigen ligase family protein [Thermoleophilaceae bacterium]